MPRGTDRLDEARLQGRLWTPAILDKTMLGSWWDASDTGTLTFDTGNNVNTIRDKSAWGNTLSRSTVDHGPVFSRTALNFSPGNGAAARPGLTYNSTSESYSNLGTGITTSALSAFTVLQFNASSGSKRIAAGGSSAGATIDNAGEVCLLTDSGGTGLAQYANNGFVNSGFSLNNATIGQAHVASGIYNGTSGIIRCDGYQSPSNAHGRSVAVWPRIGSNSDGFGFVGVISEAIFTLMDPTLITNRIEGYLAWKWGLVDQLNPAHPYKNRPPTLGG